MLAILLDFLDDAQSMQPQRRENCQGSQGLNLEELGKEPFGCISGCSAGWSRACR